MPPGVPCHIQTETRPIFCQGGRGRRNVEHPRSQGGLRTGHRSQTSNSTIPRASKRPSPPIATPSRKEPASACRSTGPRSRTISAMCSARSASTRAAPRGPDLRRLHQPDAVRRDRDGQHVALGGEHVALASCTYEATAFAGRITISPMAASIWPRRLSRSATVCD
jgi:hypothetical protein